MRLNDLPKVTTRKQKRKGRGYGSGKGGHTVGRGAKGLKARGEVKIWFEGGQLPLMRRMPMLRGKNRMKPFAINPIGLNVKYLNLLPDGVKVDLKLLVGKGLVKEKDARKYGVKILGGGELERKLTVALLVSKGAREKIEKAGGKVE